MEFGTLEEIQDLRSVWPDEARDFTPWLAKDENISLLSDTIGLDLELTEIESQIGGFHADIVACDVSSGKDVIIENQLEATDHDHLGKLITYASGKKASYLIWIVRHAREEHRAAIEWLNAHTDDETGFFLLEVKLYKIRDSVPAVKFEIIEQPNEWSKAVGKSTASNPGESEAVNLFYWSAFNEFAKQQPGFLKEFRTGKPSKKNWCNLNIPNIPAHIVISTNYKNKSICLEIYTTDKSWFDQLLQKKDVIENQLGELEWVSKPNNKSCRAGKTIQLDPGDGSLHFDQFKWFTDQALDFKKVFLSASEV